MSVWKNDKRYKAQYELKIVIRRYDTNANPTDTPINLLKHLAPLWETGIYKWNNVLTIKHTSPAAFTYHIQPTDALIAKLPKGKRTSPKIQLRTAIDTLRSILLLPAGTEHRKLTKDPTSKTTLIYSSWHAYIKKIDLLEYTPIS